MSTPNDPSPRHATTDEPVEGDRDVQGTASHPAHRRRQPGLAAVLIGIPVVLALMLLAFLTPALHSGPVNLPIAVSGPAPAVEQVTGALQQQPGAFDVQTVADAQAVTDLIKDREVVGGIALSPDGVQIQTATGAGAPYAGVLQGIGTALQSTGQQVTVTDVAPTTADDPSGAAITAMGLPLIFGGVASAVLLWVLVPNRTRRVVGLLAVSTIAGLVVAAIVGPWFGAVDANYWALSGAVALGVAAVSATILGLVSVMGIPGLALGAVLMLFVANPISGLATGPAWLPQPWGEIGQWLPIGAAGTVLRSTAYFDGHGMTFALLVLTGWLLLGLILAFVGRKRMESGPFAAASHVR